VKWLVPGPQKLVAFLQGQLGDYSGKFLRRLLEANLCRINGRVERFGSRLVQGGDAVELAPSWKSVLTPQIASFETLYEDEFLKIVDKPAGWVCTDAEALRSFGPKHYLVHRLDKDTTGLLILAKSPASRDQLMEHFEKRLITKHYLALVDGAPSEGEGTRKSLLGKKGSYQGQTIWGSMPHGLTAITHWKRLAVGNKASLLLCMPETGRTHQIRVHLAEMGHPILVDRQYAKSFRSSLFIQRPLLHAYGLQFSFQGKPIDVTAPIPADFFDALKRSGIKSEWIGGACRNQCETPPL
jgi:RluA family pseudouridine synthase